MSELQNKVEIHMEHIGMVYPADGKEVTEIGRASCRERV